jgi:hypothetical protein
VPRMDATNHKTRHNGRGNPTILLLRPRTANSPLKTGTGSERTDANAVKIDGSIDGHRPANSGSMLERTEGDEDCKGVEVQASGTEYLTYGLKHNRPQRPLSLLEFPTLDNDRAAGAQ